ncbi:hypothetical protein GCM10025873_25110 [Demequina sediminis]|uniref:hypothetical protein n=1 Tax=Demequina sediminis TaxID=1930058 RepID=UPI0025734CA8|nr:hypothetical protein [Demequina sediminis]BDZ62720.1 hypothetical protein GCM10025873_25110 [Demequina sediminis]
MARIDIVFPGAHLPQDGIGDHTRWLAEGLGVRHDVTVLGRGKGGDIPNAEYADVWGLDRFETSEAYVATFLPSTQTSS